jgi:hypothetical protein
MRIFNFDPADHSEAFQRQGWVHIEGGIDPEFLAFVKDFVAQRLSETHVEGSSIGGTKDQSLFDFPEGTDYPDELFDKVAGVCGLSRPTMTLSERHIKAYDHDSPPELVPHKDRYASQVSVGLSITIPEDSRLLLYPNDHVSVNPFNVSWQFRDSLQPHEQPEVALAGVDETQLHDRDGDVVMFPGSAVWHCRRNSANSINLYLKFNDFGSDPLGEDPNTQRRREATLAALSSGNGSLGASVPLVSRRLDTLTHRYSPQDWTDIYQACVFDEKPVTLSPVQVDIVRQANGDRDVAALAAALSGNGVPAEQVEGDLRKLAELGVLDLVSG